MTQQKERKKENGKKERIKILEDDIPDKNLLFSLFFTRGSSNLHEVKYCPTFLSFLLLLFLTWRRRGRRKNLSGAGSTPSKNGHQWGRGGRRFWAWAEIMTIVGKERSSSGCCPPHARRDQSGLLCQWERPRKEHFFFASEYSGVPLRKQHLSERKLLLM